VECFNAAVDVRLPSGRVTFAFTDVVGSTRAYAELGDAYVALQASMHRQVAEHVHANDGAVVKTQGDGTFLVFEKALSAVKCLRAIQSSPGPEEPGLRLPLRAGAHSGDAVAVGGDYVSYAAHVAARVTSAAGTGQALVSQAVIDALPSPEGDRVGAFALKDLAEPVVLWRIAGDAQPPRAHPARRTNLAPSRTSFLGREDEIAQLRGMVSKPGIVTVVGSGGVGKTRLASELGLMDWSSWSGGAWLVELSAVIEPGVVAEATANALGLTDSSLTSIEAELVRRGEVLLILDNCEHVIDAAAELTMELSAHCRDLRVLATSREPLGLDGERVLKLRPLVVAGRTGPAERLFVERARSAGGAVSSADEATVSDLCRCLDGVPLALELAAARAPDMPLPDLTEAIRQGELSMAKRSGELRQRSLDDLVSWSLQLLSPGDHKAILALSVLPGGFSAGTATSILGQIADCSSDALPKLCRQSLVDRDGSRYRMLMVIRTVVHRQLVGDEHQNTSAYSAFFSWSAQTASRLDFLSIHEDTFDGDMADAFEEALASWGLPHSLQGCGAVLRALATWAMEHPRTARHNALCSEVLRSSAGIRDPDDVVLFAAALKSGSGVSVNPTTRKWDRMTEFLESARRLGEPESLLYAIHSAGVYEFSAGDHLTAHKLLREAVALVERTDSLQRWRGAVLADLGVAQHLDGDLEAAEVSYRTAIICDSRETYGTVVTSINLSELLLDRDEPRKARDYLVEVMPSLPKYEVRHAFAAALLAEALWRTNSRTEALLLKAQAHTELSRLKMGDPSIQYSLDRLEASVPPSPADSG
jgi:class 3 adenylate cyclase